MRVAIFSDNFYPELSGVSDSIISLAKELSQRGHFIHFYVPYYSPKDFAKSKFAHGEIDLGPNVEVTRFPSFYFGAGSGQGRMVITNPFHTAAKDFNPDVVHTQMFFGVGLEALLAARRLHKPLVGTNHTAIKSFLIYNPIKAGWTDNLILKYVNWYYERCIIVTAPSRSVFKEMEETGFKKKGIPLSNPIETAIFKPLTNRATLSKKFGFGSQAIIHAGRLARERDVAVMIRALPLVKHSVPDAELVFAGRGVDEPEFRKLAVELGVGDSVKFLGFVDQSDLVKVMNAGKVFAITSTSDTQSMVTMQAMACGLPVVGVNARALPEYIKPANGFIVEPGDHVALAKRLIEILKDPALQKKLGNGGRKEALQYSPEKIADRWEKIYSEAIEQYKTHEA